MAKSTLANSLSPHQLFAEAVWSFAPHYRKPLPEFLVFPTGNVGYHWCVAASATKANHLPAQEPDFRTPQITQLNEQPRRRNQQ